MQTTDAAVHSSPLNNTCRSTPATKVLWCISLLTVTLNFLVITSILYFRQLHTPTNVILLSLAVSDFFVGLVVMPSALTLEESCWVMDKISCVLLHLLDFTLTSASVGSMVLISIDRYVAICNPLRYSSMITPSRVKMCVYLCWSCSVFYNTLILQDFMSQETLSNYIKCFVVIENISGAVDLFLTFFGPITVIIALYARVFLLAWSQARHMRAQITAVRPNGATVKKSEIRAARTLGIVLLMFIICFTPYHSSSFVGHSVVQIWLYYFNSCLNPLIYAFFYPWFRKSVKLFVSLQVLQPGSRDVKLM